MDLLARLRRSGRGALLFALFAVPGSCNFGKADIAQAPEHPTFDPDVKQVLADHCLLCHGDPPNRGAPSRFRLDVYNDVVGGPRGAFFEASDIIRTVDSGKMPPAALWGDGVGPNGKLVLDRWLADGAPP